MYDQIIKLMKDLALNSYNPETNYYLGKEYENIGQTASAVAYYLRAIEYGYKTHQDMTYSCLVKIGNIFKQQGNRAWSMTNAYLQAIAYNPSRPEAYFFMSKYYEEQQQWQESYTNAAIGLSVESNFVSAYNTDYPGKYALEFQKAVAAWWIGRKDESQEIMINLNSNQNLSPKYREVIQNNINFLGETLDKIAIILPVRNNKSYRAERLKQCLSSWKEQTENLSDLHIIIDEDELEDFKYLEEGNYKCTVYVAPTNITLMQKINLVGPTLAEKYKYLAFVGDDIVFKTPWESKFIEYLSSVPAGLAFCNTVHRKDELATHPVITSNMVRALGFYGCPAVHHNYFDNFWMDICRDLGNIKYFDDIVWDHSREGWQPDNMYWKIVNLQEQDQIRYTEYKKNQYRKDLDKIKAIL